MPASPLDVSPKLARNVARTPGGDRWLAGADAAMRRTARAAGLRLGPQVGRDGWTSLLRAATTADGREVIVKTSLPHAESRHEATALAAWDGHGAARLVRADDDGRVLVLERLRPGTSLTDAAKAEESGAGLLGRVLGDLLPRLWVTPPCDATGRPLLTTAALAHRWAGELDRAAHAATAHDAAVLRATATMARELAVAPHTPVLLHGDLHAGNVLRDGDGWRAIDPKPLVGDPAFDPAQALRDALRHVAPTAAAIRRLADDVATRTGLDPDRVRRWTVVKAAAWSAPLDAVSTLIDATRGADAQRCP